MDKEEKRRGKWKDRNIDRSINEKLIDGKMDRWRLDRWIDGRVDRRIDG